MPKKSSKVTSSTEPTVDTTTPVVETVPEPKKSGSKTAKASTAKSTTPKATTAKTTSSKTTAAKNTEPKKEEPSKTEKKEALKQDAVKKTSAKEAQKTEETATDSPTEEQKRKINFKIAMDGEYLKCRTKGTKPAQSSKKGLKCINKLLFKGDMKLGEKINFELIDTQKKKVYFYYGTKETHNKKLKQNPVPVKFSGVYGKRHALKGQPIPKMTVTYPKSEDGKTTTVLETPVLKDGKQVYWEPITYVDMDDGNYTYFWPKMPGTQQPVEQKDKNGNVLKDSKGNIIYYKAVEHKFAYKTYKRTEDLTPEHKSKYATLFEKKKKADSKPKEESAIPTETVAAVEKPKRTRTKKQVATTSTEVAV